MIVQRMFSSKSNKDKENSSKKDLAIAAGLTGGTVATQIGASPILKGTDNPEIQKESEKIAKKLIEKAKKQGTNVHDTFNASGSHYLKRRQIKNIRRALKKLAPKSEKWAKIIEENTKSPSFGKAGDYVYAPTERAELLAHELGHSTQAVKGRGGSKLGRLALKAYMPSKLITASPIGPALSFANGYQSGKIAKRKEDKGEKEGAFNKIRTAALPAAAAAPMLATEADASIQGMKMLKKAGASKALRRYAGKTLLGAGLTYAGLAGAGIGAGYLGRAVGKRAEAKKLKKEKEKK